MTRMKEDKPSQGINNASHLSRFPPFDNSLSEDEVVVKKFVDKLQFKVDNNEFKISSKERKIIETAIFNPGIYIGGVVGVATFAFLRKTPIYIMNRLLAKYGHGNPNPNPSIIPSNNSNKIEWWSKFKFQKSSPPLSKQEQTSTTNIHTDPSHANTSSSEFKEGFLLASVTTIFDAILATFVGLSAWALTVDKKKALNTMADIPLMDGKSEISDSICDEFVHIYRNETRPKFWKEYSDDTLSAIQRFVNNCEKRDYYQWQLRRERGLGVSDTVELPFQVPHDIHTDETNKFGGEDDWAALEDLDEELHGDDWEGRDTKR